MDEKVRLKLENRGEMAWVSVDNAPSKMLKKGQTMKIEVKRRFCVCGNPLDPWRIVVDGYVLETKRKET